MTVSRSRRHFKHDGYRFICWRDGDRVRVFSRRGLDWTERVPSIVEAMRALRARTAVIDGAAVVARNDGVIWRRPNASWRLRASLRPGIGRIAACSASTVSVKHPKNAL